MKKLLFRKCFSFVETVGLMVAAVLIVAGISQAVTVPNTFVAGTPGNASEVNANFDALVTAVTTLETKVAALENSNVMAMDPYVTVTLAEVNSLVGPHVMFHDANVHIQNGTGTTDGVVNGLGNLVVGYNEAPVSTLNPGERDGSHNLIVGEEHRYLSFGGFVAGLGNTLSGTEASISGGTDNIASGPGASVSGGGNNTASGDSSSVSGGTSNTASGLGASVSGGFSNMAIATDASVSGGQGNTASNLQASVSGGFNNTASGGSASVSGGELNTASGSITSISGGSSNTAAAPPGCWKAGTSADTC